jgi:2-polyprenyl-6-methoxyphenol hydroxylase-like FAD-dependent oxidoreductase
LAAAVFLAREEFMPRVVEQAEKPSEYSRALAVNPRTLEILEPSGVTARMLELGRPMRGARFWHNGQTLFELSFAELHHKYPFMLALSQAVTERLLADAFAGLGGVVERGVELVGCRNEFGHVVADLRRPSSPEQVEQYVCPWLLGADGSHSAVRESLGIDFPGSVFERTWQLADLPLSTSLAEDMAHVFILDGDGFVFYIPVIDNRPTPPGQAPIWRVLGNVPDLLSHLQAASPAGPPVWESSFRVAHRVARRFQDGQVCLAGDAAHVHSPVGARGMNLGIEDVWVLARLVAGGTIDRYDALRRGVDSRVVARVERLSRAARGESPSSRFARRFILPRALRFVSLRRRMLELATGLDHELDVGEVHEPAVTAGGGV